MLIVKKTFALQYALSLIHCKQEKTNSSICIIIYDVSFRVPDTLKISHYPHTFFTFHTLHVDLCPLILLNLIRRSAIEKNMKDKKKCKDSTTIIFKV